jgi:N-acetyl-gamma-glutamyl-phosphate reductase
MELAPSLVGNVGCVVDLSAAFRLKDPSAYPTFYGFEHTQPDLLASAVFGLPELHRAELKGARSSPRRAATSPPRRWRFGRWSPPASSRRPASSSTRSPASPVPDVLPPTPTCSPTSTRTRSPTGCSSHRHTPEMEQEIGAQLLFTPHLVPMSRGLLATCTAPAPPAAPQRRFEALASFYADEPFVAVLDGPPATKSVLGSNAAHVNARYDERTDTVIAMCAIDNLTKGASGGAVQAANVALGLDETAGLATIGLAP